MDNLTRLATDLARNRTAAGVLQVTAESVVGLVPHAASAVATVLHLGRVALIAATDGDAESVEAWQHALAAGPAVTAAENLGRPVVVDQMTADARWPYLHGSDDIDRLPSVVSVATALPTVTRTLVLSWYGSTGSAFAGPGCERAALLVSARAASLVDRALEVDHRQAQTGERCGAFRSCSRSPVRG